MPARGAGPCPAKRLFSILLEGVAARQGKLSWTTKVPLLSITNQTSPRLLNRVTLVYAACGLVAWAASLWFLYIASPVVLVGASVGRLSLGIVPAAWIVRRLGWGAGVPVSASFLALPYPVDLAAYLHLELGRWIPNGPTEFLIFIGAVLMASRFVTAWAIARFAYGPAAELLRPLGNLLFVLTAAGVLVVPGPYTAWFLHHVPEPIAFAGYCGIAGYAESERSRIEISP